MNQQDEIRLAIENLKFALTQLEPDGNLCAICGDTDHQAFECDHNPVVLVKRTDPKWRCFHCNEVFDNPEEAEKHFGTTPEGLAKCLV